MINKHLTGLFLGAAGGALGTLVMTAFQEQLKSVAPKEHQAPPGSGEPTMSVVGRQYEPGEDATEAVGRIAYETVTSNEPPGDSKPALGGAVHWAFGIGMGALYGVVRPDAEAPDLLGGLTFGTAVWLVASELMLPVLGLAPSPAQVPLGQHAGHFAAHLIYGAVTSATTQGLRELTIGEEPEMPSEEEIVAELEPVPMMEGVGGDLEQPGQIPSDAERLNLTSFGAAI